MKVAILSRGTLPISKDSIKGTETWVYNFIRKFPKNNIKLELFSSGDSKVRIPIHSLHKKAYFNTPSIKNFNYRIFRNALISQAFIYKPKFDLYHDNTNCGDLIMSWAQFINRPILVTIHGNLFSPHLSIFFSIYKHLNNVYFVAVSQSQRKAIPSLNFIRTIYHGIDTNRFVFSVRGGQSGFWAGRGTPEKSPELVVKLFNKIKQPLYLAIIRENDKSQWLKNKVLKKIKSDRIKYRFRLKKSMMIKRYGKSKVLVMPYQWEEPFGLVMIESMACGTPVVAYARGSVPEIIKDGQTGFIVNSSEKDKRGDWIVKKTGIEGLLEAVEKIYAMPEAEYLEMRRNCRKHIEKHFTIERMINDYVETYKEVVADYKQKKQN
ncbi:hypothetical protein A2313_02710 [Candidatus Roizmanbacteria bacterium RIFOXYB2_FULL_41_10]|uniref:Glycosyl transferase family 1 domain-containing protein n=1 Tax=Candidatus Roizmanbacteria bacterium RIFOXYA1_FULL_41_12 TaxID=1802082 RepID=A0A1F7KAX0_9BACT|nr:MAG: hypothetical protein A2209_04910 [Candidatus Roizmanbacteria bacterium RIFOXYA1_FULL_41_12]OGK66737.1 MAG: hypothetical protein A2377_02410 [Candidatus Roizmanbacteria bacterium RIFOXYB1_FULL_41_27]OGK67225.1 MAG: hypothetical protein A2262_03270 [Candidatus Roizmanbacteria bacterium RIFOXYA2_FULL_41_8]OGK70649.1 MAG: hypothetical protein A2313_02710 [Candidatus Roizmanbacteria bacterium RIFOXYB2_FULL_41_10]OGK70889.1 MAG: hypothetical protein A2403_02300 [Candidatus Roizmanbacteria bac